MKIAKFQADISESGDEFPHFWEHTVGSGHATLALRADWQRQIRRCHQELGFHHVRFHGILSDDVGTLVKEDAKLIYSFFNADQICDFLLSIGMTPFVELSFMPSAIASGKDTVFHYKSNITPPQEETDWETLIQKLVQHWADRYGTDEVKKWFFEVWNEPNLKAFWTGNKKDYFRLYEASARAIKSVHPELRVGGPATANNEWIGDFVSHCQTRNIGVDFISTHHYPTDAFGKPGDDTIAQLAASHRSVLREEARQVKKQAHGLPVYYTEWNTSSNPFDELHDQSYAAAFIVKTVMEAQGLMEAYSFWTFSDIFEENYFSSKPFHGGFGLLNIHGIPKPAYRAYEMLHHLGSEILEVKGHHETVDAWVTRTGKKVKILFSNSALPTHTIKTENLEFRILGSEKILSAVIERIDNSHANSFQCWKNMGRPESLNPHQVQTLETASQLKKESISIENNEIIRLSIAPHGVICISLEIE